MNLEKWLNDWGWGKTIVLFIISLIVTYVIFLLSGVIVFILLFIPPFVHWYKKQP